MIYKKISWEEYCWDLRDRTGAYLVIYPNGDKEWLFNGLLHREDGPAIESAEGVKAWWIHGEIHREDGPATEWADGTKEWYIHGEYYGTEEEWQIALDELRAKEIKDLIV